MLEDFSFDRLDGRRPMALFLDIDGTLVEFAATPDEVVVPPTLRPLLERLSSDLDGAFAVVTGRPIESADRLFRPTHFTMAGLHGGEFRCNGVHEDVPAPYAPWSWKEAARALADANPGVAYEEKRLGFSIHYREAPEKGPIVTEAIEAVMQRDNPGFHLLHANMALEIRPDGIDKGHAIRHFMRMPQFAGRMPVFFGDDTTDDDGFRVLKDYGGVGVVVGHRRPPEASYTVRDPAAMRRLLSGLLVAA